MPGTDAGFDPKAYEEQVVKPLRRRRGPLPDDLVHRYAVDLAMDPAALEQRVKAVVQVWNGLARQSTPVGLLCTQLIREHDKLRRTHDLADPRFWRDHQAKRSTQLGSTITDLAAQLTASHGELGVITASQLKAAAAAHGALGDAELHQACAVAALRLVEPLELPTEPGTRGRFKGLEAELLAAGIASIPALLFPGLTEFGLLGRFVVTPAPAGQPAELSFAAAEQRSQDLAKSPDSSEVRPAKVAVGLLMTEAKAGTDLAALALYHLLAEVRQSRADGAGPRPLFTMLAATGLRRSDAAHLAVSVLAEAAARRDPAAEVSELLAEGRLLAAKRLATALSGPAGDTARQNVARRGEQVEKLRADAAADVLAGREEQAATRLREAVVLGSDVPGLAEELAKLPAAPVIAVTASADGGGVRIAWRPAASHHATTAYRVVRREGRDPDDVADGQVIPTTGRAAADPTPPVGRRLHYAVFARSGTGRWSRAAGATVQVVPPVTELLVEGGTNVVTGWWKVHPDVVAVEVRRTTGGGDGPGEPVAVERHRTFRDEAVTDGTLYLYSAVACYRSPTGGTTLRSTPVVARGTPRTEALPVTGLTVVPAGELTVRLTWRQRLGTEVVIRRSTRPSPWGEGEVVPRARMEGYGHEVDGRLTAHGESMTLDAPVPSGRSVFVPFTLDRDGGVRGQEAILDLTAPPQRVAALRFGDDIRLTWVWPEGVSAADVRWAGGHRRITVAQLRDEGGCQLRGVPRVRRVEVSAVVFGPTGEESTSQAVALEVEERPPELHYELRRRGRHLLGGVTCTVTVTGEPVAGATLIVVAAPGGIMPRGPEAGVEIARRLVVIDPAVPMVVEASVPKLGKPYWLRCFLAEPAPALLVDPPVTQLKVS